MDEHTRHLLDSVQDLDFSAYAFMKNSSDIIDGTPTTYYYTRMANANNQAAAARIKVRWSPATKAATLLLLQRLWIPGGAHCLLHAPEDSPEYDAESAHPLLAALFTCLHLVGHGELFEAAFHPQAAALARYLAGLAVRHGLTGVESGWTVKFGGECSEVDVEMMMKGASAWLSNVTREK